jgi:surface protein
MMRLRLILVESVSFSILVEHGASFHVLFPFIFEFIPVYTKPTIGAHLRLPSVFCIWRLRRYFSSLLDLLLPNSISSSIYKVFMLFAHDSMEWPVDILVQLLGWLAWDGASVTFQHLAYLTINSLELKDTARKMPCPLVLDVHIDDPLKNQFRIPFFEAQIANIKIDWGDGKEEFFSQSMLKSNHNSHVAHEFGDVGGYVVRVFAADNAGPVWLDHLGLGRLRTFSHEAWFRPLRAVRSLGTLGIRSLCGLFKGAEKFNLPLSHLDLSAVTDLSFMFSGAGSFNQPIEKWNVSNVTNMSKMFNHAVSFNQPLSDWDVGKVLTMKAMFNGAEKFDGDISRWDVSSLMNMKFMFAFALEFNQPITCQA